MWLNSYFTSSAAAVPVLDSWSPPPSATPNDLGHRPVTRLVRLRPSAHLMHCRHCPELTPGAQKTSNSPSAIFFQSWLALSLARHGRLVTIVHGCITALHGLQINCATLKWFPSAGRTQTWPWARSYFLSKAARDIRQRDMVPYFWTAPVAWFQGETGPNSEESPCPSVTSYRCSAEGFYPTVFEHRTPLGKPLSRPSASTTIFSAILHGELDRADDARTLLQIWLTFCSMDFEKTSLKFGSTTLSAGFCTNHGAKCSWSTWPWVFIDVPTKFQQSSCLIGRASRYEHSNTSFRFPMKTQGSGTFCSPVFLLLGAKVPKNECSRELSLRKLSFQGANVPGNICSMEG